MKIRVAGMDPSLSNWGIAEGTLDLDTGELSDIELSLIETKESNDAKQVRKNSLDLVRTEKLALGAMAVARRCKVIFVECPVGSQSARAMASYGACIGILGVIRSEGIPLIEVTASEVKISLTKNKEASKQQMIEAAVAHYPKANWPTHSGRVIAKAEHLADAIGTIHAGVCTPMFINLMRLLKQVTT